MPLKNPMIIASFGQRDGLIGPEHFMQIEVLGPKLRALLGVYDGKAEMPDRAKLYFHVHTSS